MFISCILGISFDRKTDKSRLKQTLASCLVTKSIKPNPLWFPEPAAFFGSRAVFNSPNVLKWQKKVLDYCHRHQLTQNTRVYVPGTRKALEVPWLRLGRVCCAQGFWFLSVSSQLASSCLTPQFSCEAQPNAQSTFLGIRRPLRLLVKLFIENLFKENVLAKSKMWYASYLVARSEIFNCNWWPSTLQCWGKEQALAKQTYKTLQRNRGIKMNL